MSERKRKPKIGSPRTEVFAMRLDPQLKYLGELAARKQRRSLANFVEWAIEQALSTVSLNALRESGSQTVTVADKAAELWSPDEATRLVNLATRYPDLLSYEERLIWDVVCNYSMRIKDTTKRTRFSENGSVDLHAVRQCWMAIKSYALGTGSREELDELLDAYLWSQFNELHDAGDKRG
jgi:hypothetical protein